MTIARINGQEREVTTAYTARDGSYEATAPTMDEAVKMVYAMQQGGLGIVMVNGWQEAKLRRDDAAEATAHGTVEVQDAAEVKPTPAKTRGQEIATRLLCLHNEDFLVMKSPCGGVLYLGKGAWKHTEEVAREILAAAIDKAIADDRAAMDDIIEVAVKKEREACAAIADRGAGKEVGGEFTEGWTRGCETTAALIRSQK